MRKQPPTAQRRSTPELRPNRQSHPDPRRRQSRRDTQAGSRPRWQTWPVGGVSVYLGPDVAAVRALWTQSGAENTAVVVEQLAAFADALRTARARGQRSASVLAWNWSHDHADELSTDGSLSERDARLTVARDHGFASWQLVSGRCDPSFEQAVDAVVMGRLGELRACSPINRTSSPGGRHTATEPHCCTTPLPTASRSAAKSSPTALTRSPPSCSPPVPTSQPR